MLRTAFIVVVILLASASVNAKLRGPRKAEAILATVLVTMTVTDVILATDDIRGNTWSEIIRTWSSHTVLVPWIAGVLAGHLFHPFDIPEYSSLTEALVLSAFTVGVAVTGFVVPKPVPRWVQSVYFLGGTFAGSLLWRN
ncbi:MAG: hypothetical protein MJA83_08170 [Gammaproteobacteria bacterium]|nr:hypothetical protein [Gammaproteobacteria bacterium]